jgi:hypothetical protein
VVLPVLLYFNASVRSYVMIAVRLHFVMCRGYCLVLLLFRASDSEISLQLHTYFVGRDHMLHRVVVQLLSLRIITLLAALLLVGPSPGSLLSHFLNAHISKITSRLSYKTVLFTSGVLDKLLNLDSLVVWLVRRIVDFLTSILRILQTLTERRVDQRAPVILDLINLMVDRVVAGIAALVLTGHCVVLI